MKKLLFISLAFLALLGCEKKFDNVVDVTSVNYQIKSINYFSSVDFTFTDSSKILSLELSNSIDISNVSFSMTASDGIEVIKGQMYDDGDQTHGDGVKGDNIYCRKVYFGQLFPNGQYSIEYFITEKNNIPKKIAIQTFAYNNHQEFKAPVLSNLVMADSVATGQDFIFTVKADDPNGIRDLQYVFFKAYRPDGSIMTNQTGDSLFFMLDNGDFTHFGDQTAGDAIYSYKNNFIAGATKGVRRFEFLAIDRSGLISNKITHYIKVL